MNHRKTTGKIVALALAAALSTSLLAAGCDAGQSGDILSAQNLMEKVTSEELSIEPLPEQSQTDFANATADFSLELFRKSWQADQNTLVSPVSAVLALGMVANGAGGNTQTQFLETLADAKLSAEQLNEAYAQWSNQLTDLEAAKRYADDSYPQTFRLANAIWLDQEYAVKPGFLQTNADFFQADAYQLDFSRTEDALKTINQWASDKTDGKIQEATDSLDPLTRIVLTNATLFEMPWFKPVEEHNISSRTFHTADGKEVTADFLHVWDGYLESDLAYGMKRSYRNQNFSFVALLPKEGHTLTELVQGMKAEEWLPLVNEPNGNVILDAYLPKFRYEASNHLEQSLADMGLSDAFAADTADFSGISDNPLFIGGVTQNTFIDLNENGTSAAAVTTLELCGTSALIETEKKTIVFDQPFLYAILDNNTGLPLFLGTVANPGA